jgi:hypothetical protein
MKSLIGWSAVALLIAVYVTVAVAVLHPHVSPEYRAYYIDHTTEEWKRITYPNTPQQGISFGRIGLPEWVLYVRGFSHRDDWGRWTDQNVEPVAGLVFTHPFRGPICVDFTARTAPWIVDKVFVVKMGSESHTIKAASVDLTNYEVEFGDFGEAAELDFLPPGKLPRVYETLPESTDPRRVGLNLATLRLIPGECPNAEAPAPSHR